MAEFVCLLGLRNLRKFQWESNVCDLCARVLLVWSVFFVTVKVSAYVVEVFFRHLVQVDHVHFVVFFHTVRVKYVIDFVVIFGCALGGFGAGVF